MKIKLNLTITRHQCTNGRFHCSGDMFEAGIILEQKYSIWWARPIPATSDTAFPKPAAILI